MTSWPTIDRDPPPTPNKKRPGDGQTVTAVLVLLVVVAGAVWGITSWQANRAEKERQQAQLERTIADAIADQQAITPSPGDLVDLVRVYGQIEPRLTTQYDTDELRARTVRLCAAVRDDPAPAAELLQHARNAFGQLTDKQALQLVNTVRYTYCTP